MDRLDRTLTGPLDRTLTASELPSLATPTLPSPQSDRFIPTRSSMDLDCARYALGDAKEQTPGERSRPGELVSPTKEAYKRRLAENLLAGDEGNARVLSFKASPSGEGYEGVCRAGTPRASTRLVPQAAERILDAPDLVDDYYLNLLDWSCGNVVAVALGAAVFLWSADDGAVQQLAPFGDAPPADGAVTSVSWAADGKHLAVGTSGSEVQIWDAAAARSVRTLRGHSARVSALAWAGSTLASGGKDTRILQHDVRVRSHVTATLVAHTQEVCGLRWSPSGSQLASGGNDNALHVWDGPSISRGAPLHSLCGHTAAVKALAWCPWQANTLASGGGTADRRVCAAGSGCIKFWNSASGALLGSTDTGSQVCSLAWNPHERELLSSHGYSHNQLCLWRFPTMAKVAELSGHSARVLHMAVSPDGTTVVSAAADETLRFWRAFGDAPDKARPRPQTAHGLRSINIR